MTGYLVAEILNAQSPEAQDVLLSTSILEQVSAEAASELTGDEHAARILQSLAQANAFVQLIGRGQYRYHWCLAEVLRLKLRHEHPDRAGLLHRRAARWYPRNGQYMGAVERIVATARSGWSAPVWLDHKLSLIESRAYLASGNIHAALAAAARADPDNSPEAAVALARAWLAAKDSTRARRALAPALELDRTISNRVRLQACLADAWLSYASGNPVEGRRSLATALRLAEPEQLRLPFAMERHLLGQVLRHDPELATSCRRLLGQTLTRWPEGWTARRPVTHPPSRDETQAVEGCRYNCGYCADSPLCRAPSR